MKLVGNIFLARGTVASLPRILALLDEHGISTNANPDLDIRTYTQFSVDDARALVERAQTKSIGEQPRVFIMITPNMTYEAQNALLKTLEEPPGGALFFFLVPAPDALLATVRSRAQILDIAEVRVEDIDMTAFLRGSDAARLDMLKPLLARDENDVRDISSVVSFLGALEQVLAEDPARYRDGLEAVYRARKYLGDKGSLIKSLLEQVALLTPRV